VDGPVLDVTTIAIVLAPTVSVWLTEEVPDVTDDPATLTVDVDSVVVGVTAIDATAFGKFTAYVVVDGVKEIDPALTDSECNVLSETPSSSMKHAANVDAVLRPNVLNVSTLSEAPARTSPECIESASDVTTSFESQGKLLFSEASTKDTHLLSAIGPAYVSFRLPTFAICPYVICVMLCDDKLCSFEIFTRMYESRQVVSLVVPLVSA
jgi:hypothetical protein